MTASDNARQQSEHGPQFGFGECLLRVRGCFGALSIGDFDGDGDADAEDGWKFTQHKHPQATPAGAPGGVVHWWGGGSHDNGHVAFSPPDQPTMCWSTDIRRTGFFDLVPITEITQRWGLPYFGWSEDINGVRVWTPEEEDDMVDPKVQEQLDRIEAVVSQDLKEQRAFRQSVATRDKKVKHALEQLAADVSDDATRGQVRRVLALLTEAPE